MGIAIVFLAITGIALALPNELPKQKRLRIGIFVLGVFTFGLILFFAYGTYSAMVNSPSITGNTPKNFAKVTPSPISLRPQAQDL